MLDQLLRSASGEVRIKVTGASLERFLNLCMRHNIRPRALHRQDWDCLECTLSLADLRRLRPKMGRTGCRVHILRKSGLPFILRQLRRRAVFTLGFFALAWVLWLLQTHLWILELSTPPEISSAELSRALEAEGVKIGMRLSDFDDRAVQRSLMLKMDSISYVTFNRIGNHMIVQAHAKADHDPPRDDGGITSVVARRPGQIVRVTPLSGWAVVKAGDIVDTGEKLIDALVPPSRDVEGLGPHLTWSDGEVIARTWYETTYVRPLTTLTKRYTGKTTTQYALIWGKHRINLYLGSGIYGTGCDKIVDITRWTVRSGLTLPIGLVRQTYRWYEPVPREQDAEQLRTEIEARAAERLAGTIDGELTSYTSSADTSGSGALEVHFRAEALEDIGEVVEDPQVLPPPEPVPSGAS